MGDLRRPHYKCVNVDWVYEVIQERLNDNSIGKMSLYNYIDEVQYTICNYINRDYVPEPLKYVVLNMTMDLLKSQAISGNLDNDKLSDTGIGTLTSIKDGDSELKFATSKTNTEVHTADVDSLLYNYTSQLNKYRLIKW